MSILEVKNLKKRFGKSEILKGISFSLEKGEVLSILGASGSGKTTLLRCLTFLEQADDGVISVDGNEIFNGDVQMKLEKKEKKKYRLNMGLVFQNFNLFPQYTALENVTLAPKKMAKKRADYSENKKKTLKEINDKAVDLLTRVGLADKLDLYPSQLSGGQQQRVAIARALALEPNILCFDEPTSALDPELTGEVLNVIRSLADQKMTMIIVTHEMAFARDVSDKIIFMDKGIIVESGAPEQMFSNPKTERFRSFLGNY